MTVTAAQHKLRSGGDLRKVQRSVMLAVSTKRLGMPLDQPVSRNHPTLFRPVPRANLHRREHHPRRLRKQLRMARVLLMLRPHKCQRVHARVVEDVMEPVVPRVATAAQLSITACQKALMSTSRENQMAGVALKRQSLHGKIRR